MPTTDEWWAIDGVSLHEQGWNVTTVGGSRYDLPPRRGSNITVAKRPGQMHRDKPADSRTVELIMWVTGVDPTTGAATGDPVLRWNDSWDYLRRLVWRPTGSQVDLTRRWRLTVDGTPTVVAATAKAEIADSMAPTMTGRTRATFAMRMLLADPYFYGSEQTYTLNVGDTVTVNNPGHDIAAMGYMDLDFYGPLTNPRLTNAAFNPDVYVQVNMTIPDGVMIRASVPDFTFRTILGVETIAYINWTSAIKHSGARFWMGLYPGDNPLTLTGSGGGHVTVRYRPPYI